MAADIPTYEPKRLRAGDTWRWVKTLTDYPADTWTLSYALLANNGASTRINISTTANNSAHEVNVANTTTANYTAGNYRCIAYVDDGTNVYTLDELDHLYIDVLADPRTVTSLDERTYAERILDKLETAMESLSTGKIQSASENGKSYSIRNMDELKRDIGFWSQRVWVERSRRRIRQGFSDQNRVRVKFVNPR